MVKNEDPSDEIERRKHERVEFSTSISAIIDTAQKKIEIEGGIKDLSLQGVFIITDEKVSVSDSCAVKIILSGGKDDIELNISGVVARNEADGIGIVFDSIDIDSFTHLKNIVKYMQKR